MRMKSGMQDMEANSYLLQVRRYEKEKQGGCCSDEALTNCAHGPAPSRPSGSVASFTDHLEGQHNGRAISTQSETKM